MPTPYSTRNKAYKYMCLFNLLLLVVLILLHARKVTFNIEFMSYKILYIVTLYLYCYSFKNFVY